MLNDALEIISTINKNGQEAYIVGGYVRDYYLNIQKGDIDIATSIKPKELSKLFSDVRIYNKYLSSKVKYKGYNYDITSFRRDLYFFDKLIVLYKKSLKKDVLRRDFTINSLYMDINKNIIDLLDAKKDLDNKIIRTIKSPKKSIKEDPLRILRAIRYAGKLDFKLSKDLEKEIKKRKNLLNKISFDKKREELDKCFSDKNVLNILKLIKKLGIDKELNISYNNVSYCDDLMGVWAQIKFNSNYIFKTKEKKQIDLIRQIISEGVSVYTIYKYNVHINEVCAQITNKKINVKKIYDSLLVHSKKDINISFKELSDLLNTPYKKVNMVYNEIEKQILLKKLKNDRNSIISYIKKVKNNE